MKRCLDSRGAVMVEYLLALLPVLWFFASTWQIADLCAAHLIVQRAASAVGRAASVVLPDDPHYYGGADIDAFEGARRADLERAANLVLQASPRIATHPRVQVSGASGIGPVTATIEATYLCIPGWGIAICGPDGRRTVRAQAEYAYHSAPYQYQP